MEHEHAFAEPDRLNAEEIRGRVKHAVLPLTKAGWRPVVEVR
ncbi:MAG TPA: hypothetical protein PK760_03455 [Flavobacteriales bacterium]|nr:hypothetical protein [Flavobacteriales bacterium]